MRPAALLATAGVTLLVLTGCASTTETAAPASPATKAGPSATPSGEEIPPPPDLTKLAPCTILTRAEAEKLARTPLAKGVVGADPESPSCTYNGPTTGPSAQVGLVIGPGAKKYFDIDKKLGTRPRLAGLADEAYSYAEGYKVYFRKDTTWVVMSLVRLEDHPYYMKALVSLARTVASRIPNG
jgi:uncharacterized protein DUF3558